MDALQEIQQQIEVSDPNAPHIISEEPVRPSVVFNIFLGVSIFLIGGLAIFLLLPKASHKPAGQSPLGGASQAIQPSPTLTAQYSNPFDSSTQYLNPFSDNQNPFDALQQ